MSTLRELMATAWCGPDAASGPTPLGWVLVAIAAAIVCFAYTRAIRNTLRPGESERSHIKWRILDDEDRP